MPGVQIMSEERIYDWDEIEKLGLRTQVKHVLKVNGLGLVGSLSYVTAGELLRFPGLHKVGVQEIEKALAKRGRRLRQAPVETVKLKNPGYMALLQQVDGKLDKLLDKVSAERT